MIAILLMILGACLIIISIIGFLMYLFQPLRETYQVVIKRRDDYALYATPSGRRYLREKTKVYLRWVASMFILGCALFLSGLYMKFGPRGFKMLLSNPDEIQSEYEAADPEVKGKIDENGDYRAADGKLYKYYLLVRGNVIYLREDPVSDADSFEEYASSLDKGREIYVVDDYASSKAFHEVIRVLEAGGFSYESD